MTELETKSRDERPLKKRRRIWKTILLGLFVLILATLVSLTVAKRIWDSKFFDGYVADLDFQIEEISKEEIKGDWRESLRIQVLPGEMAPIVFHYPDDRPDEGAPCVVMLYGIGQKLSFLDEIARDYVRNGVAILGLEQLGQGERKRQGKETSLEGLLRLRKRSGQTLVETRRIVDYLVTRPEIDADNLFLYGISMGAVIGASALAMEPRFKGGILMWGGGDLKKMVSENRNAKIQMKPYQRWLASCAATLFTPVEPLNRIHLVSPRPILFQNALHDEIVPKVCTEAYYGQAGDPKEILWYDCGHENGLSEALFKGIIDDQIEWLQRQATEIN